MIRPEDVRYFNFAGIAFELTNACSARCRSCLRDCAPGRGDSLDLQRIGFVLGNLGKHGSFREVGFTGGECFLRYELLLAACRLVRDRLGFKIGVATNGYWAVSAERARALLEPLAACGLHSLLVSVDDFHLEFIPRERIENCLNAGLELGLRCSAQVIHARGTRRAADFRKLLALRPGPGTLEWIENPCDPVGRARREVAAEEFGRRRLPRRNMCSVLRLLAVRLDGSAVPCCGTGAEAEGLVIGNVYRESVDEIVQRALRSPLLNSLAVYGGPWGLVQVLEKLGRPEWKRRAYTSPCEACFEIFSDAEVTGRLREALAPRWVELLALRLGWQAKLMTALRAERAAGRRESAA